MKSVRTLALFLSACALSAQVRPQFVWQGEVDGLVVLHLRDNKLQVQVQEGAPVERQKFQFYDRLPQVRQDARVEMREGRGYVHIVEQPRLENRYTLAVAIEDRQPGTALYSIAIYWDPSNRSFEGPTGRQDKVVWSGRVKQEVIVSCRAKTCVSDPRNGLAVGDEHFKFSRPLPDRPVEVRLEDSQGRGEIRLIEQPSERNQYTARVLIRDREAGAGEYSFTLSWARGQTIETGINSQQQGLIWTGVVDGRVRVTVAGGASFSQVVEGTAVRGERADFLRPLPARSDLNPTVKQLRGHADVQIMEYPSAANDYRLVFEIHSRDNAPETCEIEVDW